jgi:alkylation response protein AidB-like acyl-CoA dehydrogenase
LPVAEVFSQTCALVIVECTLLDLTHSVEDEVFRSEVRAFPAVSLPARLSAKVRDGRRVTKADQEEWHASLNRRGWLASHWPEEYRGWGGSAITLASIVNVR